MNSERGWATPLSPYVLGILRISYGILWLQQAMWKIPPDFGMAHGDGLYYWTKEIRNTSAPRPSRIDGGLLPYGF